jgi:zinc D-Ala-D-Ala carboxypeptidase
MPRRSTGRMLRPVTGALGAAFLAGCAALQPTPPEPAASLTDVAERTPTPADERYPWCQAPPLPAPDDDYLAAISRLNQSLGIAEHRLVMRGLRPLPTATQLQAIDITGGRGVLAMSPDAAPSWILMQAAARADGVELIPLSTYRSPSHQRWIVYHRLRNGEAHHEVLQTSMAPGYSEHHTGDAIDIGTPAVPNIATAFADTEAFAWLEEHAGRYCFELSYPEGNREGVAYEPWHWRLVRRPRD